MRPKNPARVLSAIQLALQKNPELRVGQLLCLALRSNGRGLDMFHVEDDDLASLLGQLQNGKGSAVPE
jgi:hypothetical protein